MRDKVLIIDDVAFNREMLTEILEGEYAVITADDGQKGIDLLAEHEREICVVLLDLIMPVMDGFEVMQIMERRGYLKQIPVLVISGETAVDIERRCFDYGVTDFIKSRLTTSWSFDACGIWSICLHTGTISRSGWRPRQ